MWSIKVDNHGGIERHIYSLFVLKSWHFETWRRERIVKKRKYKEKYLWRRDKKKNWPKTERSTRNEQKLRYHRHAICCIVNKSPIVQWNTATSKTIAKGMKFACRTASYSFRYHSGWVCECVAKVNVWLCMFVIIRALLKLCLVTSQREEKIKTLFAFTINVVRLYTRFNRILK